MKEIIGGPHCAVRRVAVIAAATLSVHCGSEPGDAVAPSAAEEHAALIVQTVHAREQANVFVQVEPNSTCNLRAPGTEDVSVYGDVRGVAAFFASLDEVGATADLSLVCQAPHGARSMVHPVRVTAVPDDEETSAPTAWLDDLAYPGRSIAALAEDPERVTPARLAELGLPIKPDRVKAPQAYTRWLERVSKPALAVEARLVETGVVNTIVAGDPLPIWAGYLTAGYTGFTNPRFGLVLGEWAVPFVDRIGPFLTGSYYSSTWVGLGGQFHTVDVAMPQAGTAQQLRCTKNNPFNNTILCLGTYYPWVEYYPLGEVKVTAFSIRPGDVILAELWPVNDVGFFDPYGPNAMLELVKVSVTPNVFFQVQLSLPPGKIFYGDSANWIMERPYHAGQTTNLAKFRDTTITSAIGMVLDDVAGQQYFNFADDPALTVHYDMGSFDHVIATASPPSDPATFTVHWVAPN